MFLRGGKKDKGFSSKNKIQQHHGDGTETILLMGRPFRVLQRLEATSGAIYLTSSTFSASGASPSSNKRKYSEGKGYYVYLVENSCRMTEFPRHLTLKRSFFPVDQVNEAHMEIGILERIKDKNIVRVYHSEISRSEGTLGVSIAMEYCGNNLYRRIRSGCGSGAGTRLSESEICHVLLAMTSALGYLHALQPPVAHRDIRPENILINNSIPGPTAYKLCNFGSATTEAYECDNREEASLAIADIEIHTNAAFRSPEMADPWSRKRICEKTDLWSLGVLVYYMMYLKLPFEPTNMALSSNPTVRFPAGQADRYSGALRVVVEHLLDPNPDSRWDVFALTNFLRFDEDISRHLGTFCFSRTEWPEGWEEQDTKVLNRAAPKKAPPVSYHGEPGHETAAEQRYHDRTASTVASDHGPIGTVASRTHAGSPTGDDVVRKSMIVLGGDPADDDPQMAQYRERIIREQEEAWERAKSANNNRGQVSHSTASPVAEPTPSSPSPPPPAKKDLFDDLFAGPSSNAASSPSPPDVPPRPPQPLTLKVGDPFRADDLFGPGSHPQPTQLPPMAMPPVSSIGGSWGPVPSAAGYFPQDSQGVGIYSGYSPNSGSQPGLQPGMGGGPWGGLPPQQPIMTGGPSSMNPPPPPSMDFATPTQGPPRLTPSKDGPESAAAKKDPFMDLFY